MKNRFIFSAVLFTILGMMAVGDGLAATYKYVDKDGQIGFADDLQMVPEPYRATATLISGEAKEKEGAPRPGASARSTGAGAAEPVVPATQGRTSDETKTTLPSVAEKGLPLSMRLAISIGIVIAAILVSVFLGKVTALYGHDRAIHILRVSLSWLVVIYLVAAHAKDVLIIFKTAGHGVQAVSDESAKKGEKAANAIKALDAMFEQASQQVQEHDRAMKEAEQAAGK